MPSPQFAAAADGLAALVAGNATATADAWAGGAVAALALAAGRGGGGGDDASAAAASARRALAQLQPCASLSQPKKDDPASSSTPQDAPTRGGSLVALASLAAAASVAVSSPTLRARLTRHAHVVAVRSDTGRCPIHLFSRLPAAETQGSSSNGG